MAKDNQAIEMLNENPNMYTDFERDAILYQGDGTYDSKPVEVVTRKLYHVKPIVNANNQIFFDNSSADTTVSNVQGSALPAGESHTVHEVIFKVLFGTTVTTPNALMMAFVDWCAKSTLIFGVKGKNPWIEEHLSSFLPSGVLAADNAALTNVKFGESISDATFRFAVPKVIGEKVNIVARIDSSAAPNALLHTTNSTKIGLYAGGITVRAR